MLYVLLGHSIRMSAPKGTSIICPFVWRKRKFRACSVNSRSQHPARCWAGVRPVVFPASSAVLCLPHSDPSPRHSFSVRSHWRACFRWCSVLGFHSLWVWFSFYLQGTYGSVSLLIKLSAESRLVSIHLEFKFVLGLSLSPVCRALVLRPTAANAWVALGVPGSLLICFCHSPYGLHFVGEEVKAQRSYRLPTSPAGF